MIIVALLLVLALYRGFVSSPWGLDGYLLYLPGFCFLPLLALQILWVFRPLKAYFCLLFCSVLLYFLWLWPLRYHPERAIEENDLSLVSLNFHSYQIDIEKAGALLKGMDPDFICFQEVWTRDQLATLKESLGEYEFACHPTDDEQEMFYLYGTFVAWKPEWRGESSAESPADTVVVTLSREGERFLLVSLHGRKVHAYDPIAVLTTAEWQAAQGRELAELCKKIGLPVVVAGDFNAPASGPAFKHLPFQSAFDKAGQGFGATFPSTHPFFRIDHVLGSEEVRFKSFSTFEAGSDHLGLWVRFDLGEERGDARD